MGHLAREKIKGVFMKKILFITLSLGILADVYAAPTKWGSKCGLTDSKDQWAQVSKTQHLDRLNATQASALPTLLKQQLIITAKHFVNENSDHLSINSAYEAIQYLKISQGPDVSEYQVRGRRYTEIRGYPGDNPYGVIFQMGTLTVVAYNEDDSIRCR